MSPTFKMNGVLRFSVLTSTFNMDRFASVEEAAEEIFSEKRMALRLHLFEKICLPSLTRQRDQGFDLVVATSDRMPEQYLTQLMDIVGDSSNISIVPFPVARHYGTLSKAYGLMPRGDASHQILFRLDDDDALDVDYIARTKRRAAGLVAVQGASTPFVIAYNRGFYLQRSEAGEAKVFDAIERAPLSVGTALVRPAGTGENPYRYNHRKFAQHYNTFSDITVPGFIRTHHWDNHSEPAIMGRKDEMTAEDIDADLRAHFGLSLAALKAI